MKKILAVILVVFMLGLTGCVKMVEMTDEESETIARTAAWLLFKYDNNYTENLIAPTPTPTPVITATPTPSPTPTPVPGASETAGPVSEQEQQKVTLPEYNVSPDEIIGTSGLKLAYDGYELYDSYTFNSFSVEPKNPEKGLLLLFLQLQNDGAEAISVNLLEMQPKCGLYVDTTELIAPKKTVLLNDFQYLVAEVPAGGTYNSVLVFEVEKMFDPQTMDLYISVGDDTAHMNLQ